MGSLEALFGAHSLEAKNFLFPDCISHSEKRSHLFRVEDFQTQQPSNLSLSVSPPITPSIPVCAEPESSHSTHHPSVYLV